MSSGWLLVVPQASAGNEGVAPAPLSQTSLTVDQQSKLTEPLKIKSRLSREQGLRAIQIEAQPSARFPLLFPRLPAASRSIA